MNGFTFIWATPHKRIVNVEHKKYFRASFSPSLSTLNFEFRRGLDADERDDDEDEPS